MEGYKNLKLEAGKALAIKNCPAIIISKYRSTAYVKDIITNKYSKQHFSNLSKYEYNNEVVLPENWDQLLHDTMAMGGDEIASSQQTISQEEDENTLDESQIMVQNDNIVSLQDYQDIETISQDVFLGEN